LSDSRSLIVFESTSLLGDISSPLGRALLIDAFSDDEHHLFWVQSVWAGASDYVRFDVVDQTSLVFDEVLWRGSLTEIDIQGNPPFSEGIRLTQGNTRDRQPAYSPDGELVAFSSNRSGNLDIWTMHPASGELRQITDDDADDWDPAFSRDGQSLYWSSNRAGHLEIWTARADGSNARQLSQDGEDAENPTETPDGWVVYASANPERPGIWKVRKDGGEAIQLAPGNYLLPEVSPDGKHVIYIANDPEHLLVWMSVADIETNEILLTTSVPFLGLQSLIQPGRPRWMPDGKSIVFTGPHDGRRSALFIQDFQPGEDTIDSRRPLVVFESGEDLESFGISPDGKSVTVARIDHFRSLKLAEDVLANE